jgi:hypothetical protein
MIDFRRKLLMLTMLCIAFWGTGLIRAADGAASKEGFQSLHLKSSITGVQPMTGIVLWTDNGEKATNAIQLEYQYVGYNEIVDKNGNYSWTKLDNIFNAVAGRKHQAIIRFYDTYPGKATSVPLYIKNMSGYKETSGICEGQKTYFPDWSFTKYQEFILDFFKRFAAKYDNDPRLAFLEAGFGLWGEYHIYEPGEKLGVNFPSKSFQTRFIKSMSASFSNLYWMISIDAADDSNTPFAAEPALKNYKFGLFDDSFLCEEHGEYNEDCFAFFGTNRYSSAPNGGELSYYTEKDQKLALSAKGPYGISFETMAKQFHISFMIGNDQPQYQTMERIKQAGMATGYRFKVTSFMRSTTQALVKVKNVGIAPLYYDAYVTVDGKKAATSLKYLQPGAEKEYRIDVAATVDSRVAIQCDRLVSGQTIEYEADL